MIHFYRNLLKGNLLKTDTAALIGQSILARKDISNSEAQTLLQMGLSQKRTPKAHVLSALVKHPSCPSHVDERIGQETDARILAAWVSARPRSSKVLESKLLSDKRATLAKALAELPGLSPKLYMHVLRVNHFQANSILAANSCAPMRVRKAAASLMSVKASGYSPMRSFWKSFGSNKELWAASAHKVSDVFFAADLLRSGMLDHKSAVKLYNQTALNAIHSGSSRIFSQFRGFNILEELAAGMFTMLANRDLLVDLVTFIAKNTATTQNPEGTSWPDPSKTYAGISLPQVLFAPNSPKFSLILDAYDAALAVSKASSAQQLDTLIKKYTSRFLKASTLSTSERGFFKGQLACAVLLNENVNESKISMFANDASSSVLNTLITRLERENRYDMLYSLFTVSSYHRYLNLVSDKAALFAELIQTSRKEKQALPYWLRNHELVVSDPMFALEVLPWKELTSALRSKLRDNSDPAFCDTLLSEINNRLSNQLCSPAEWEMFAKLEETCEGPLQDILDIVTKI